MCMILKPWRGCETYRCDMFKLYINVLLRYFLTSRRLKVLLKLKTTAAQVQFQPGASAACLVISKKTDKKCIIKDLLTLTRSCSHLISCSYEKIQSVNCSQVSSCLEMSHNPTANMFMMFLIVWCNWIIKTVIKLSRIRSSALISHNTAQHIFDELLLSDNVGVNTSARLLWVQLDPRWRFITEALSSSYTRTCTLIVSLTPIASSTSFAKLIFHLFGLAT